MADNNQTRHKMQKSRMGILLAICLALLVLQAAAVHADGSILVEPCTDVPHEYCAYQLISGKKTEENILQEVEFGPGITSRLWEPFSGLPEQVTATDAAEWIAAQVGADTEGIFPVELAQQVLSCHIPVTKRFFSGETVTLPDGYYLITSDQAQPILALLGGGGSLTIQEKSTPPMVDKNHGEVEPDGTVTYRKLCDSGQGEVISWRIEGTLPSNYNAYKTYKVTFHDSYDRGIRMDPSSLSVLLEREDGTVLADFSAQASYRFRDQQFDVLLGDLKSYYPSSRGGERIVVFCEGMLDPEKATTGSVPNKNEVTMEYSSSPTSDQTGTTQPAETSLYTWKLEMLKASEESREPLKGAEFVITDEYGRYLNTDETLSFQITDASVWTTDASGKICLRCLDTGSYTVTEIRAPAGYRVHEPFLVTVSADYSREHVYLHVSLEGQKVSLLCADADTGVVSLLVDETPVGPVGNAVPHTGDPENPVVFLIAAGCAAAAAGVAAVSCAVLAGKKKRKARL